MQKTRDGWDLPNQLQTPCLCSQTSVQSVPILSSTHLWGIFHTNAYYLVPHPAQLKSLPKSAIFNCCATSIFKTCNTWPIYLVRGTDLFSIRLSNKMPRTNSTVAIRCEWIKIILFFFFLSDWQKTYFFGVLQNFNSLCVMKWKRLKITALKQSLFNLDQCRLTSSLFCFHC